MSKSLIIAEKPSVAKDIAKVLGKFTDYKEYLENEQYVISWAVGHLLEQLNPEEMDPKFKAWKLEDLPIIPDQSEYKFSYKVKSKCEGRLNQIKRLLKRTDITEVIDACDAGREGELIFREIMEYLKCSLPTKRLWLQSMTPDAIREAFRNLIPGHEKDSLGDAAKCRSEADWIIGINSTRAFSKRLKVRTDKLSWSAGRVQTPTLAMLAERELAILSFRPTPFWRLKATFAAPAGTEAEHNYEGTWYDPNFSEKKDEPRKKDWIVSAEQLQAIMDAVRGQLGVVNETRKPRKEGAHGLFDLTTLQREANKRFGMSAKSTLAVAQSLYETHKLITYPRTSSKYLPGDYRQPVGDVLRTLSSYQNQEAEGRLAFPIYVQAASYLQKNGLKNFYLFDDKKISDHFAIIPTTAKIARKLRDDEAKIYDLIVRRFLAAFYPDAMWTDITRDTVINGQHFGTSTKALAVPGWYEVYGRSEQTEDNSEKFLPELKTANATARNTSLEDKTEQTKPPARLTDASLLSRMESAGKEVDEKELQKLLKEMGGLGTPATRAEIIETLLAREYIERMDHALRTTPKGIMLIDVLKRIDAANLTSPELTGTMEMHLQEVENQERQRRVYMKEIASYISDIVDKAKNFNHDSIYDNDPPIGICPNCGGEVREHMRFYSCVNNKYKAENGCQFIIWKDRSGRYLERTTVLELLKEGRTQLLEGFPGGHNTSYQARLRLNAQTFEVEFDGEYSASQEATAEDQPELPVDESPVGICPFDPQCRVLETSTHYQCEQKCLNNGKHPKGFKGFVLPRIVCKRIITRAELLPYLSDGKTALLEKFTSRNNKPFNGYLVLQESGRHRFEFEARNSRKKTNNDTTASADDSAVNNLDSATATAEKTASTATRKRATATAEKTTSTATRKRATTTAEKTASTATRKRATTTAEKTASTATRKRATTTAEKTASTATRKRATATAEKTASTATRKRTTATAEKTASTATRKRTAKTVTAKDPDALSLEATAPDYTDNSVPFDL